MSPAQAKMLHITHAHPLTHAQWMVIAHLVVIVLLTAIYFIDKRTPVLRKIHPGILVCAIALSTLMVMFIIGRL